MLSNAIEGLSSHL